MWRWNLLRQCQRHLEFILEKTICEVTRQQIWPIDALLEVLGCSTLSIYLVFYFEWQSNLSDIPIWVTFQLEGHFNLSDVPIWVTLQFEWHFNLRDIPIWVTFQFKWHSNLSDIPILGSLQKFYIEWHSILSDIPFEWRSTRQKLVMK